jgi:hypothetical protein
LAWGQAAVVLFGQSRWAFARRTLLAVIALYFFALAVFKVRPDANFNRGAAALGLLGLLGLLLW